MDNQRGPNAGHDILGTMESAPRFLTISDVADVLNVSVRQVRALLASGDLLGIQIGGRGEWRIENVQLETYIDEQYQAAEQRRRASERVSEVGGDDHDRVEHQDPPAS